MKKLLIVIIALVVLFFCLPKFMQNGLKYNFANVDDYHKFDKNTLQKSTQPIAWQVADNYNKKDPSDEFLSFFKDRKTCAYLVIKDNKIVYENYWENYNKQTISGSFSMAKTVNALLIGKLIEEGKIASVEDDVKKYVPELQNIAAGKLKIKDVLTMSANIDYTESYANLFSITSKLYYGDDLAEILNKLQLRTDGKPGSIWEYQSCCTQILGYIIKNTSGKSLAAYAQEKLWQPLGAESDAIWSVDKNKTEKSYCCLNATARDFAKLGQMVLQNGKYNQQQVIDSNWIAQMITPATYLKMGNGNTCDWYGYQTWIINYKGEQIPYFRGILGQFIFVLPRENAVIVRLGKKIKRNPDDPHQQNDDIRNYIEAGLDILDNNPKVAYKK